LEEALRSFHEGDYDDVLANCRMVVEQIVDMKLDMVSLLDSDSKAEKMDAIVKRTKDYLNLGAHAGVKVDRKDAEVALHLTATIARYIAQRLQRP